jgi:hypothetical protein
MPISSTPATKVAIAIRPELMNDASPVMTPPSSFAGRVASRRERANGLALRANGCRAGGCGSTLRPGVDSLRANVAEGSGAFRLSC